MTWPKTLSRDYTLSFFAQFSFSSVFCILIPAIPIYLHRFGAKEGEIGFLIGIFSVSSLILRPFVGRALLTIPERNFMIPGTMLYVLSSAAYLFAPPFWPLFIVRVIQGIGLGLFSTASFTLVANITPARHRGQLISYFYLSFNMAFALGPYFGMLMLNIIWGTLTAFLPLYALRHGVSNPGIFFIFLAITLLLGRILGGKILDIYDRKKVIVPCLTAIFISMVILTFSTTLPMFILVAVILGTGWALLYPSLMIYAIENAGAAQGPAMGTFTALGDLGAGMGPMIMGIILQGTSYPIMFSCLALTGAITFLYFHYIIGKGKKKADQMMDEGT